MRGWRQVDVPAVAGFGTAVVRFTTLVVELAIRGRRGFATSRWEPLIILGWLGESGWLSSWAYRETDR